MKCAACDKLLSDFETNRKIIREDGSIYYPDLCNNCFTISELGDIVNVVERTDLPHDVIVEEEYDLAFSYKEEI